MSIIKSKKKLLIILIIIAISIVLIIGTITWTNTNKNTDKEKEARWNEETNVNPPILMEGMKAITFSEDKEEVVEISNEEIVEGKWYNYKEQKEDTKEGGTSKWANAITEDGSMWVWIPRYAYKIEWNKEEETVGRIDIMFLKGTTNKNKNGEDVTKLGYIVHPAFQDGTQNKYKNGEWDKEITGIWVSKFEAGYANEKEATKTNIKYEKNSKNIYGEVEEQKTNMTYPVFKGKAYSYNNITIGEMYKLSQSLNEENNPYGFSSETDTHLIKNSEWGAVAYLAHSKYGRNGSKIAINNIDTSKAKYATTTITGYVGDAVDATTNEIENIENEIPYAWYTKKGVLGSTTGNQYGIYDMNGGASEYTAGYLETIDQEKGNNHGKQLLENKESTKYCTIYKEEEEKYGDAIFETSKKRNGFTSLFDESSIYVKDSAGFFLRSGAYNEGKYSGMFSYTNHSGHSLGSYSFRSILIKK